jgi:hypothetical protein
MRARAFWRAVTVDHSDVLERVLALLHERGARYCAIGGVAVNAYVEPLVTLDLDLVVAVSDWPAVESALLEHDPALRSGVPADILDKLV